MDSRTDQCWPRYVELLNSSVVNRELQSLAAALGRDAKADAETLREAARLLESVGAGRDASSREREARASLNRLRRMSASDARGMPRNAIKDATFELDMAKAERDRACAAVRQLNDLRALHPALLRHIPEAKLSDVEIPMPHTAESSVES